MIKLRQIILEFISLSVNISQKVVTFQVYMEINELTETLFSIVDSTVLLMFNITITLSFCKTCEIELVAISKNLDWLER